MLAFDDLAEAAHGIGNLHVAALAPGKLGGDVEGLREELLHLPGARHRELVIFTQFVETKDGDDVLQVFIALQQLLHALGHIVMLLPHDARIENARGGSQRIHRRINPNLGQRSGEHRGRVKMCECSRRSWIGQVIGGHINRLHRSY